MAGMALQCLKESDTQVQDAALDKALGIIKQKLLDSRRADGHMGNEFSTGLAVQVRTGSLPPTRPTVPLESIQTP